MALTPDSTLVGAVKVRRGVPADALCIGVLGTQVFLDTYATEGVRPALAEEVLEHFSTEAVANLLAQPDCSFLLAEARGHLVGFAQLRRGAQHALVARGPTWELARLYVQRRSAGAGVGTLLMRHAEALAAADGARAIWLTAWTENRDARDFYARRGFVDVGAVPYVFRSDRYENRLLVRDLDHAVRTPA